MRDFVGYGMNPPVVRWPDGARIAVQIVVNYEEGAEYSLLDGDPQREPTGDMASPIPLTERDLLNESFFEYALALERNPEIGREITRRGHEPAGHGYRWIEPHKMSRDEERADIAKA